MGIAIGIDLGTTNSCVAVVQGERARVLEDRAARRVHPSIISFREDGETVAGYKARDRQVTDPKNTIHSAKRLIGRDIHSEEMRSVIKELPYEVIAGPDGIPMVKIRNRDVSLPEVSALMLRHLKNMCLDTLGIDINEAVITVPANFDDVQRSSTKVAGRIAGFDVLRILNEPTAAALAYGFGAKKTERVAVYDFGGGTFDITIVELSDDIFEVLSTAGDSFLGGDDFDRIIATKMLIEFRTTYGIDLSNDSAALQRVRSVAERVKCQLSSLDKVQATLKSISKSLTKEIVDFYFQIERKRFNTLIEPLVVRSLSVCDEALELAGIRCSDLDSLVMVGGTTRTPLVRKMVAEHFGIVPRTEINPDEVVAIGAAIQAFSLTGEQLPENLPAPRITAEPQKRKRNIITIPQKSPLSDSPIKSTDPAPGLWQQASDAAGARSPSQRAEWKSRDHGFENGANTNRDDKPAQLADTGPAPPSAAEMFDLDVVRKESVVDEELALDIKREKAFGNEELALDIKRRTPVTDEALALDVKRKEPFAGDSLELDVKRRTPAAGDELALDVKQRTLVADEELGLDIKRDAVEPIQEPGASDIKGMLTSFEDEMSLELDVKSPVSDLFALDVKKMPDELALDIKRDSPINPSFDRDERLTDSEEYEVAEIELEDIDALDDEITPITDDDLISIDTISEAPGPTPFSKRKTAPAAGLPPPEVISMTNAPVRDLMSKAPKRSSLPTDPRMLDDVTAAPGTRIPSIDPVASSIDVPSSVSVISKMETKGALLLDVTPRALGVAVAGGFCDIIIERNAAIPVEQSRRFTTSTDHQTEVSIDVYQGESRRISDNTKLGQVVLTNIRSARRGEIKIKVTFEIDTDGILGIFAVNEETGAAQSTKIVLTGEMDEAMVQELVEKYAEK